MPLIYTTPFRAAGPCSDHVATSNYYFGSCSTAGPLYLHFEMSTDTPVVGKLHSEVNITPFEMSTGNPVFGKLYSEVNITLFEMSTETGTHLRPSTAVDVTVTLPAKLNAKTEATLSGWDSVLANHGRKSGKWYWEITLTDNSDVFGTSRHRHGIATSAISNSQYVGQNSTSYGHDTGYDTPSTYPACYFNNGIQYGSGGSQGSPQTTGCPGDFGDGDIMMVAVDLDALKIWWGKNGTWEVGGNPAAGTGANFDNLASGQTYFPAFSLYRNTVNDGASRAEFDVNFGPTGSLGSPRAFMYTPPTGFGAW